MSNSIKFIISTTAGFVNKGGFTEDLQKAKTFKSIAGAAMSAPENAKILKVNVVTQFSNTTTELIGEVSEAEITADIERAEALKVNAAKEVRDDKVVYFLETADGQYFNKGGFTNIIGSALTSANPDYLAGFVAKTGVVGHLRRAVSTHQDGRYVLTEISDVIVEIPTNVTSAKIIDGEIVVKTAA